MIFTSSSDKIVRKKTVSTILIFTFLPLMIFFQNTNSVVWPLGFFICFMLLVLFSYLHKPIQYQIENNKVIIRRPIGNVEIDYDDINPCGQDTP